MCSCVWGGGMGGEQTANTAGKIAFNHTDGNHLQVEEERASARRVPVHVRSGPDLKLSMQRGASARVVCCRSSRRSNFSDGWTLTSGATERPLWIQA